MKNKLIFALSGVGLLLGCVAAVLFAQQGKPLPPVFQPAADPFASGIYAIGIVESDQGSGENINLYPEVAGTVAQVLVGEGQAVRKGEALLALDGTVQRALTEQQRSQAEAALAQLQQLKAEPRPEALQVAQAQVRQAEAALKTAQDQYDKLKESSRLDARSVSKDALDTAADTLATATAAAEVVRRQYQLTRAGAWSYELRNQQRQYDAAQKAAVASGALLDKYTLRAPVEGVVLSVAAAVGSYVSPQGTFGTYTGGMGPVLVIGTPQDYLGVRCYVDEILVNRLPAAGRIKAQMSLRGSTARIPLEFVRVQPYVSPKIALSDARQERVDVRVLPVIFRFRKPADLKLYPGQQVDIYIGEG